MTQSSDTPCRSKQEVKQQHGGDSPLRPGDAVIIRGNPHDKSAGHTVGTVRSIRAGQGVCGSDLVYVRYTNPTDGKAHTMPFARRCLSRAEPRALLRRARQLEARAASLRALAEGAKSQH